ncbi:MAG: hypothetical protein HZB31_15345 [Nitrospirae bacterium]|nr:hypothetical protein [Nitrospirota bacterium]
MIIKRNGQIICIECWGCKEIDNCNTPCDSIINESYRQYEGEEEMVEAEFEDVDKDRPKKKDGDDMPTFTNCSNEECKKQMYMISAKLYKQTCEIDQLKEALSDKTSAKLSFWEKVGGIINR